MTIQLGDALPAFQLHAPDASTWSTASAAGSPGLLVMFLCNHCPYVLHVGRELGLLTQRWAGRGLSVVGLNPNDADAYPADAPSALGPVARSFGWDFPYLVDAEAAVASAFGAACTPDFFLFGADATLVYHGRFDGGRPGNDTPVTGSDLRSAVNALFDGVAVTSDHALQDQLPSMGCSIKWPPGRDPNRLG